MKTCAFPQFSAIGLAFVSSVFFLCAHSLRHGFPNSFLEPPQHCTFGMSTLSDTAISGLGVTTNELNQE